MSETLADMLKLQDVADAVGVHPQTLRALAAQGRIRGAFRFGNAWVISVADATAFVDGYDPRPGRKAWAS